MHRNLWLVSLLLLFLPGCFVSRDVTNEPLDIFRVKRLQPGMTASQVVEILGAPVDVVPLGKRSAYRYQATVNKRAGLFLLLFGFLNEDTRSDFVWVFFDEQDVLQHVAHTFASHRPQYAMPWEDVHEESDRLDDDEDRPGMLERRESP